MATEMLEAGGDHRAARHPSAHHSARPSHPSPTTASPPADPTGYDLPERVTAGNRWWCASGGGPMRPFRLTKPVCACQPGSEDLYV